jgi:hypothetical protein
MCPLQKYTQYKQWQENCKLGPIRAKISASQTKQMVLAFVHNKGMVYTNYEYMPRGAIGM